MVPYDIYSLYFVVSINLLHCIPSSMVLYVFFYVFFLTGSPGRPVSFTSDDSTSQSIDLLWFPGFFAGLTPTFELDARKAGEEEYVNIDTGK